MPRVATNRLAVDPETYAALCAYAADNGVTPTAALRVIVRRALYRAGHRFVTDPPALPRRPD